MDLPLAEIFTHYTHNVRNWRKHMTKRIFKAILFWTCLLATLAFCIPHLPERTGHSLGYMELYHDGQVAKRYGISAEANPYLMGSDRQIWLEGWMSARWVP